MGEEEGDEVGENADSDTGTPVKPGILTRLARLVWRHSGKEVDLHPEVRLWAARPRVNMCLARMLRAKAEKWTQQRIHKSAHSQIQTCGDDGDVTVQFVDLIDFYTHRRNKS